MKRVLVALLMILSAATARAETKPFGRGSWAELVAAHAGRPLVVHFWSLGCAPCLAEMPQWGELARANPGLALVLVSTDPMDQAPRQAQVLGRAGLGGVESWSFADPFADRLRFEVDRRWRGELPMTRLVGRDGTAQSVTGAVDVPAWLAGQGGTDERR
ncbi:MAG: TlpA family protein disulfide reductase [Actinomycetota bacterium]